MKKILEAIEYANNGGINVYNWSETINNYTVVSFGLGKFFEDTHERLFQMCNVSYVCDNSPEKQGKYFCGKKCISVNDIINLKNPFVIVVMGNFIPIRDKMRELNIPVMHITEMHFDGYIKGKSIHWLEKEIKNIEKAIKILEDKESANVFENIFCNKIYGALRSINYESFSTDGEYFETGLLNLKDDEVFIDIGAYTGDTIDDFIRVSKSNFQKIYSFELNLKNYQYLCESVKKYDSTIQEKITLINAGAWDKHEQLYGSASGDLGGFCIVPDAKKGEICQLVTLDETIPKNEKVTIIKMDIEGAEQKAINGAKAIINAYIPQLAICIYHKPEDLWQIPLIIKELNHEYKIYIRHHGKQNYLDTVCYAIRN